MLYRFGVRGDYFTAWMERLEGGPEHPEPLRSAISVFVRSAVGTPDRPKPADQIEALVAEHLWLFFMEVHRVDEDIVHIEGPSFLVTEPGGDGLTIHRGANSAYAFRLWEIKKHSAGTRMTAAVTKAYGQLESNAAEYLARYSLIGQYQQDVNLARFYGSLLELWLKADAAAAIGVAVATNHASVATKCFTTIAKRFPDFLTPPRLRGLVASLDDLQSFGAQVRDAIWSGL
jgi:hypothetical protein